MAPISLRKTLDSRNRSSGRNMPCQFPILT
jgi:hypothetical protein